MSETHVAVAHTKPWSRMRSLSESRGGSEVTRPILGRKKRAKKRRKETSLVHFRLNGVVFNMFHAVYSVYVMKLHFLVKNKTFTS